MVEREKKIENELKNIKTFYKFTAKFDKLERGTLQYYSNIDI